MLKPPWSFLDNFLVAMEKEEFEMDLPLKEKGAEYVMECSNGYPENDPLHLKESIIRRTDGTYFLHGKGKTVREYAEPVSVDRVKRYLLLWNAMTEYENEFGPLQGA